MFRPALQTAVSAVVLSVVLPLSGVSFGQEAGEKAKSKRPRRLVPGIEKTIEFEVTPAEVFSAHDIVELLKYPDLEWDPKTQPKTRTLFEMAKGVKFRHSVWGLDITFKPMRMMNVDIPQPNGKLQRKLIWYMVYRVTNRGRRLVPERQDDGTYTTKEVPKDEIRFLPQFFLYNREKNKDGIYEEYPDQLIPAAVAAIQERETPSRKLLNTVQMSQTPIPLSTDEVDRSVWGVATWVDVNPEIDFFSVYVYGLTNAYQWEDPKDAYQHGDPLGRGRKFRRKALMINFWRPGDQFRETEEEFIYGTPHERHNMFPIPDSGPGGEPMPPGLDYAWVYR